VARRISGAAPFLILFAVLALSSSAGAAGGSRAVAFRTPDGVRLEGRLSGGGTVGIVLAHGALEQGEDSWFEFVPVLASHGYRVLAFDFRGYCPGGKGDCSAGQRDAMKFPLDCAAAVAYLRSSGATTVIVLGASLGGHACLYAASIRGAEFDGVVSLSAPQYAEGGGPDLTAAVLRRVQAPKLFMAGTLDSKYAADARSMYRASREPRQLALLPSPGHGTDLLTLAPPSLEKRTTTLILDFIAAHS
jgi:pimeloyl-ACP methyl ester carboxylesterase